VGRLSVLIPAYNSEHSLGDLVDEVVTELQRHVNELEIVIVNDGSRDGTDQTAKATRLRHLGIVKYIRLTRNFGEHNAVMCGLRHVSGDCVAIIDDDFQNPPSEIMLLVRKLYEGYDVVYSFYENKQHGWFRNLGSAFNGLVARVALDKPPGLYLSSFKVLSSAIVKAVVAYQGPYPYLDALILRSTDSIGQQLCSHAERKTGRSNYSLRRLVRLWLNMLTGFSVAPLRIATYLGFMTSALGFVLALYFLVSWAVGGILTDRPIPPGWASLIVVVTLFSGLQLCVLGMIGEYLGRLFLTQNQAPQFIEREILGTDSQTQAEGKTR
jgi:undecaprenyl-phosphate 4-deoxy-4-formamido-L-arabinose transferase